MNNNKNNSNVNQQEFLGGSFVAKKSMSYTKQLIQLAEDAGLVCSGVDESGEPQFIGNDMKWTRYDELISNAENF